MNNQEEFNENDDTFVLTGDICPTIWIATHNRVAFVDARETSKENQKMKYTSPYRALSSFGPKPSLNEIDLNYSRDSIEIDLDLELFLEDLTMNDQSHNSENQSVGKHDIENRSQSRPKEPENMMQNYHHFNHGIVTRESITTYEKKVGCCSWKKRNKSKIEATSFVSTEKKSTNFSFKSIKINDSLTKLRKKRSYTYGSENSTLPTGKKKTSCKCVVF